MTMTWLLMLALVAAPADSSGAEGAKAEAAASAKKKATKEPAKKAAESKAEPHSGEDEPAVPPMYRWKVPRQLDYVASIGVQVSDGVPMVLEMARSSMPVDQLIQHFADDFRAAGLFLPPEQNSPMAEPMLTGLDTLRLVAYTVVFQPNPDRTTTLYLGTADMKNYQPGGGAMLDWAPVMPGASKLMRTELEVAQSAVYEVNATEKEVLTYYREALGPLGFEEVEPGTFRRGGEELRVFTQVEGGARSVGLMRKVRAAEPAPAVAPAPKP